MVKRFLVLSFFLFLLFISQQSLSKKYESHGPLISRTQNPLYLQTLGQYPDMSNVVNKGSYSVDLNLSYSNMFEHEVSGSNELFLDMELARISIDVGYGLGRDMEFQVQIPFLHFNGGYLDQFIQDYHHAFGFPNGGRERYPNGQFVYRIIENGMTIYEKGKMGIGLSDIVLGLKYNFLKESRALPSIGTRFRLKIPTGKVSTALGSGEVDYSLGFLIDKTISRWHFHLNLDYIVSAGHEELDKFYNHEILAWMSAVEFSISQPISIILQLQGSTPLFSGLTMESFNGVLLDLVAGIRGKHKDLFWGNDFSWQWSFSEDIYPDGPSVDITTMLVVGVDFSFSPIK